MRSTPELTLTRLQSGKIRPERDKHSTPTRAGSNNRLCSPLTTNIKLLIEKYQPFRETFILCLFLCQFFNVSWRCYLSWEFYEIERICSQVRRMGVLWIDIMKCLSFNLFLVVRCLVGYYVPSQMVKTLLAENTEHLQSITNISEDL